MRNNYEAYMASAEWRALRSRALERDRNQCQTCLSEDDLEVHHKTYERLGNELMEDLITLCHDCHEAITTVIRRRRYRDHTIDPSPTERSSIKIEEVWNNGSEEITVSPTGRLAPNPAQWADSRPAEQICQGDEANLVETRQDGRRL